MNASTVKSPVGRADGIWHREAVHRRARRDDRGAPIAKRHLFRDERRGCALGLRRHDQLRLAAMKVQGGGRIRRSVGVAAEGEPVGVRHDAGIVG